VRRILPLGQLGSLAPWAGERTDPEPGGPVPLHEPTSRVLDQLKRARGELERMKSAGALLAPAIRAIRRLEIRLERPLRVAVVGEFNSGKSTLTNLLVRIESLPTAVVSNTCIPTLVRHAPEPGLWAVHEDGRRERLGSASQAVRQNIRRLEVGLPSARLRAMQILDLPGLADARFDGSVADLAFHEMDVALWCTFSTQAWKESERAAWEQFPERLRSRGLLVATHRDLLHDENDAEKLLRRLRREAGASFREIVLLSTIKALAVMHEDHEGPAGAVWKASGAAAFETALDGLLQNVCMQRLEAALEVTGRIAGHTLSRIDPSSPAA